LESFNHIPVILNEPIFQKGFEIAEISHLNVEQYEQYKKSLVQYLEVKNVFDTAFEEGEKAGIEKGIEQGIEKGIEKVAKALKEQNIAIEIIAESTGLSYEAIKRI
ncbi:hypothetical protein H6F99_21145, partial [Aphanizomenon flos-aquae FACHB-1040]|nr:hypothetical protein [Aphanizomenon flos-aquae FACHB-1040]